MSDKLYPHARLLFVDDDPPILRSLERIMRNHEFYCEYASSGSDALERMQEDVFDVVISDMKMPEMDGAELLKQIAELYPLTMRIILSGYSEEDLVMKAINEGRIWGFIHKPWEEIELITAIKQSLETQYLVAESALLKKTIDRYKSTERNTFHNFVGESASMQALYKRIEQAAPSSASVFIDGPSGTGKEVAAEAIHQSSKRKDQPFIAINCAAIPSELMESEIFGHIKGAFSGAQSNRDGAATLANGGTLFLDELAEMDILLQAKLLRFIQTGVIQKVGSSKQEKVDIRFICATNRPPLEAIENNRLREDLYYRLNVVSIKMPALKERDNDAILIAEYFLKKYSESENKLFTGFDDSSKNLLVRYPWPGNVRQLQNTMHSLVVLNEGPTINLDILSQALQISPDKVTLYLGDTTKKITENTEDKFTLESENGLSSQITTCSKELFYTNNEGIIISLAEVEKNTIENAIDHFSGNVVNAASALEVSPSTLYRKLQQWES